MKRPDAVAEFLRCRDSFAYYLRRYGAVKNTERRSGGVVRFEMWPHLVEMAELMSSGASIMLGKSRQLGASWLIANFDSWGITFRNDFRVLSISMGQRESSALLEKVRFCLDAQPEWMRRSRTKDNETRIDFGNGSGIVALPSTPNAGRSETASVVQTDEFAFHEYAGENFAAYRNAIADGGQHIIVTTGNGPSGMFFSMWNDQNPEFPYVKRFWPWHIRPDRDETWYERERAAFLAGGEKHPLLFIRENPSTVEEMFTAFHGLVYEDFADSAHVLPPVTEYADCRWRVAGVDPGQGDPAAIAIIGEDVDGNAHQYGPEFYQQGATSAQDIYDHLAFWCRRGRLHGVAVDGAEGTLIATLNAWFERDFGYRPVHAANKEREMGIGHVASRLRARTLTVGPECRNAIREYRSYRWKERRAPGEADPYLTSTPVDHHADMMDATRYALVFLAQFCSGARTVTVTPPQYGSADGNAAHAAETVRPDRSGTWKDPLSARPVTTPPRGYLDFRRPHRITVRSGRGTTIHGGATDRSRR